MAGKKKYQSLPIKPKLEILKRSHSDSNIEPPYELLEAMNMDLMKRQTHSYTQTYLTDYTIISSNTIQLTF